MRNVLEKNVTEEIKAHILCSVTFLEDSAIYETVLKNILQQDRSLMTIWHMRIACWISKLTNTHTHTHSHTHTHTHRICNIYCFSTARVVARTCLSVTLYVPTLPVSFVCGTATFCLKTKRTPQRNNSGNHRSMQISKESGFTLYILCRLPYVRVHI
jgi:hypothetical protein